jgi:hypothetical protein
VKNVMYHYVLTRAEIVTKPTMDNNFWHVDIHSLLI